MKTIALSALGVAALAGSALGQGVITAGAGTFAAGINVNGSLWEPASYIGFQRLSDAYDPINPGTPTGGAWGVKLGGTVGWADPAFWGTSNITSGALNIFAGGTQATLDSDMGGVVKVHQHFDFVDQNVLAIKFTLTNVSGSAQNMQFSTHDDWDILPSLFVEYITVDAIPGSTPIERTTYFGFESRTIDDGWGFDAGAAGGTFGPSDLGAGVELNFGTIADGASVEFYIIRAISKEFQSEAGVRAQLVAAGAEWIASGSGTSRDYSVAMGYATVFIPAPGTLALLGLGGLAAARRRR